MRRDSLGSLLRWRNDLGDVVRLRLGNHTAHLLAHPDHVRRVLMERARHYDKKTPGFDQVRLILGNGLLTAEGDLWRRQRRIAQPAFHKDRIATFATVMVTAAEETSAAWGRAADAGRIVDVAEDVMQLTLRIVGEALLSSDVTADADAVGDSLTLLLQEAVERLRNPLAVPLRIPTPKNRRLAGALATLDEVVHKTIAARHASIEAGTAPRDLLTMLMEAREEETGARMSDQQLRDEVMTIFLAGHETTANALSWTMYLLSLHPAARERLEKEVDARLGGRSPTLEDLGELPFTRRVLSESLRMYPPAWMIGRRAVEDDVVGGYYVPRGSLVFVSPWVTHHHPEVWDNPMGFDPDRFTPEHEAERPRGAYFPFGAGPRLCIGQGFALMEAQLALAVFASRLRLDLATDDVIAEPTVTLRPRGGLRMRPRRR